nr:transposase [Halomonas desiderata]
MLKRRAFGKHSEQLNVLQTSLLDEVVNADIAAIKTELEELAAPATPPVPKQYHRHQPLPDDHESDPEGQAERP